MNQLKPKHALFVAEYLRNGNNGTQAAIAAGFSPRNARTHAADLLKMATVAAAVDAARKAITEKIPYNAETAMAELADAMVFAKKTDNATALARCVELRSKLMGLMVDRQDVRQIGGFQIRIEGIEADKAEPITINQDTELETE